METASVYRGSINDEEPCIIRGMMTLPEKRPPIPTADELDVVVRTTLDQMQFALDYVMALVDATPRDRWFEIPAGVPTNFAWQLGHLSVAQYGLLLFRIRGRQEAGGGGT